MRSSPQVTSTHQHNSIAAAPAAAAAAAAAVEAIFGKLCECSALNPDSDVEDEAGAQLFFDEAEVSTQALVKQQQPQQSPGALPARNAA
jgi:hypothetical protein